MADLDNQTASQATGLYGGLGNVPLRVQPCPSCGHCPTCGRGYTTPYPFYPWSVPVGPVWMSGVPGASL